MGEPEIDFTEPTVSDPCTPFERSDPEPRVEPQPTRIVLLLAEGLEVTPEAPGIFLDSREWAEISARFPELGARSLFYDRGSGHIERVEALAEEGDLEPSLPRLLRFVEVQLPRLSARTRSGWPRRSPRCPSFPRPTCPRLPGPHPRTPCRPGLASATSSTCGPPLAESTPCTRGLSPVGTEQASRSSTSSGGGGEATPAVHVRPRRLGAGIRGTESRDLRSSVCSPVSMTGRA